MTPRPSRFTFTQRRYDPNIGEISLGYQLDDQVFVERFRLPQPLPYLEGRRQALESALDVLHWLAGVSYWKTFCPRQWIFEGRHPDAWQVAQLKTIYQQGLAEFAWKNQVDLSLPIDCMGVSSLIPQETAPSVGLGDQVLLPLGGGKDSLVAWHRLHQGLGAQPLVTVQVGNADLIRRLGEQMVEDGQVGAHWVIERAIDPGLFLLNEQGAMNGHVPITAIHHALLTVVALLMSARWVVFANERSADEPTLIDEVGGAVNHQYSKSHAFESLFSTWVTRYIASDLKVFSVLRQDRELAIVRDFSQLSEFHGAFSSCNRHFHIDVNKRAHSLWCGQCPKCHFVYLTLALWMSPSELIQMFGADLLAEMGQLAGFKALLALEGQKPFECVGEADEARAAVAILATHPAWSEHPVIQALMPLLDGIDIPSLDALLLPTGPHHIPESLR